MKEDKITGLKKEEEKIEKYEPSQGVQDYIKVMKLKLKKSKDQRKKQLPIFDGKSYEEYYKSNEAIANTNLKEGQVSTGTVESKVNAVVSEYIDTNFLPDVEAFDSNNEKDEVTAGIYEDAIIDSYKKEYGDGAQDREKKVLRWSELLIQGTVILQDTWKTHYGVRKNADDKFTGDINKWKKATMEYEKIYEGPELTLINGLSFYFSDLRKRFMSEQQYVFSVSRENFSDIKSQYKDFSNFKYVVPGKKNSTVNVSENTQENGYIDNIVLDGLLDNEVEVIKYECDKKHGNHFQIFINGIPMFPVDFPLEIITEGGQYSYVTQTLGFSRYAYGKSFVSGGSVKQLSNVIDTFLQLMIRKTQKSMDPPMVNTGRRRISKRVLDPGALSHLSNPEDLVRVGDYTQGTSNGEFAMFQELLGLVDKNTVSNIFQGQEGGKVMTATEIGEVRKRSQKALALIEFSIVSMEIKMAYRRLAVLNKNWFKPVGRKVVVRGGKKTIGSKYRKTETEREVEGLGNGIRKINYIDGDLPTQSEVDEITSLESKTSGRPVDVLFINPRKFSEIKMNWFINVYRKPEKGDAFQKAEVRESLQDAILFANMGIPIKPDWLKSQYSNSLDENVSKVFGTPKPIQEEPEGKIPGVPNTKDVSKSENLI